MDKMQVAIDLMSCFEGSFINHNGEIIVHPRTNQYFAMRNCETMLDVKCKVLEWLSRSACKSEPYRTKAANENLHRFMLNGINQFLGTNFSYADMYLIYTYLGNACNHERTIRFVESGYDLDMLRRMKNETDPV